MPLGGGDTATGSVKPSTGWTRDDFIADVQTSLSKADTSLQPGALGSTIATLGADGLLTASQRPAGAGGTQPLLHVTTSRTLSNNDRTSFSGIRCENTSSEISLTIPTDGASWTMTEGESLLISRAGDGGVVIGSASTASGLITIRSTPTTASLTMNNTTAFPSVYDVPMPSGILNGDTVVVYISLSSVAIEWTTVPAGFVQLPKVSATGQDGPSGAGHAVFVAKNVTASSFASGSIKSFATNSTSGVPAVAFVTVYGGCDPVDPVDVFVSGDVSASTTPTAVTTSANVVEVSFKAAATAATQAGAPAPPAEVTLARSGATAAPSGNAQGGVAHGSAAASPSGTTIGGRTWTKPDASSNYGPVATLGLRPAQTSAVTINSYLGQRRIGGKFVSVVLTKVGADAYDLDGFLSA